MYFWIRSEPEKTAEPESAPLTEDLCTEFLFKIYFSGDLFLQGSSEPGEVRSTRPLGGRCCPPVRGTFLLVTASHRER